MTTHIEGGTQDAPLALRKWVKNGKFMSPRFSFKCLGCGDENAKFIFRKYLFQRISLDWKPPCRFNAFAVDQHYTCVECGWMAPFGIAISKEHYDEQKENSKVD